MVDTKTLTVNVEGDIATLTFTRPELHNRFDAELHNQFEAAMDEMHGFKDVRCAILASTGTSFSAGGDFDFILGAHDDFKALMQFVEEGRHLLTRLLDLPYPVIAAVQGPAIGVGATIAFGCDIVVASRTARFADPHVVVGLAAGDGGCLVWPQAAGMTRAKRHLLTGDPLPAEDAYNFGLVSDLVDTPEDVLPEAQRLAARIASLPPVAVQGTKRALNNLVASRAAEVVDLAFSYEARSVLTDDLVEAVAATREKRTPVYKGS